MPMIDDHSGVFTELRVPSYSHRVERYDHV